MGAQASSSADCLKTHPQLTPLWQEKCQIVEIQCCQGFSWCCTYFITYTCKPMKVTFVVLFWQKLYGSRFWYCRVNKMVEAHYNATTQTMFFLFFFLFKIYVKFWGCILVLKMSLSVFRSVLASMYLWPPVIFASAVMIFETILISTFHTFASLPICSYNRGVKDMRWLPEVPEDRWCKLNYSLRNKHQVEVTWMILWG